MARVPVSGSSASQSGIQNASYTYAADAEASDAYAITLSPVVAAYAAGQELSFKANTANTGAASLNVNSLGAKTLKKNTDQDLATGDIEAGSIVKVVYDGTNFQVVSIDANLNQDEVGDGVTNRSYTNTEKTKLAGIETAATADQTNAEIETAYNAQVAAVSQAEAEAGSLTTIRRWTPQRVAQAIAALAGGGSPAGSIAMYGAAAAPTGWLLADGTAVSRTTYAALFTAIGTNYGVGDGSTTFNVPNLKGRVPVGLDAAQAEFDALAETGGTKTHTLTEAEMPAHTHTATSYEQGTVGDANTFGWGENSSTSSAGATTASRGGGGAHQNLQPYLVVNYIIKT